jgi:hypothetical protein
LARSGGAGAGRGGRVTGAGLDVSRVRFRSRVGACRDERTREEKNDEGKRTALAPVHPAIFPVDAIAIPKTSPPPLDRIWPTDTDLDDDR